jgi:hypothetical protein
LTVFVRDVDEQCVEIVLDADFVLRVPFFLKTAHRSPARNASYK